MYRDRQEYHTDRTLHMMECTGTYITGERNVQGTDITSKSQLKLAYTGSFNFGKGHSLTHSLRQSDIVDYRAAYFAAKNPVYFCRASMSSHGTCAGELSTKCEGNVASLDKQHKNVLSTQKKIYI